MVGSGYIWKAGVILILLIPAIQSGYGQTSPFDPELAGQAAHIHETVEAFTDRSLYITGETIRFRASVLCTGLPEQKEWSTLLYVELVSASGDRVAQGKFRVRDHVSTGEIAVPATILTGNYMFRCYTRWMRNWDPSAYSYMPLRIINPYRPELAEGPPGENSMDDPASEHIMKGALDITGMSPFYNRGDTVSLTLNLTGRDGRLNAAGCLTAVQALVAPRAQIEDAGGRTLDTRTFQLQILPDLMGATLSGSLVNKDPGKQRMMGAKIHFTLMGDQSGYVVARPDEYGRFSVTLPEREGKLELLVMPEDGGDNDLEVRIDQDFDQREPILPAGPFRLSDPERELVTTMARKVQLREIYSGRETIEELQKPLTPVPFYGTPTFKLNMDDYVLLPTLEEVFINLVPGVTPVTRKGRNSLLIESENPTLTMFDPLIMIDQVPFSNMEEFFSVSTDRISSIDVVNDIFLKGDLRFGGIINLHSKENDMAGIDLPGNSFFIDYLAMYPQPSDKHELVSPNDQIPDTRNTLLWIPELKVQKGTPFKFSFTAPDYPGEYVVLFRGEDESGELVSVETRIFVK